MFGLAYRTDFDLKNHMEKSGSFAVYRSETGEKFIPHVIEPTFGSSEFFSFANTRLCGRREGWY